MISQVPLPNGPTNEVISLNILGMLTWSNQSIQCTP